jgi:hypothetical protein
MTLSFKNSVWLPYRSGRTLWTRDRPHRKNISQDNFEMLSQWSSDQTVRHGDHESTLSVTFSFRLIKHCIFNMLIVCMHKKIKQSNTLLFPELHLLATCFHTVLSSAYSSTLKVEAIRSSETSIDFQWVTWRYIPEDSTLREEFWW